MLMRQMLHGGSSGAKKYYHIFNPSNSLTSENLSNGELENRGLNNIVRPLDCLKSLKHGRLRVLALTTISLCRYEQQGSAT